MAVYSVKARLQSRASAVVAACGRRIMTSTMSVHALGQINAATRPCKQAGPTSRPCLISRKVNAACSSSAQQRFLSGSRLLKNALPQIVRHRQTSVVASSAAASSPAGTDRGLSKLPAPFPLSKHALQSPRQHPGKRILSFSVPCSPAGTVLTLSSTCEAQGCKLVDQ